MDLQLYENVSTIKELFFNGQKTRADILQMEEDIKSLSTSFDECPYPLFHYLDNGMYVREIHMDAGHLVCSKIHKDDYFVTMLAGKVWVVNEYESQELTAPCAFRIKGGAKNILYILADTVWIDTHTVKSDTVEEAEKEIFSASYEDYDDYKKTIRSDYDGEIKVMPTKLKSGGQYERLCSDLGVSEEVLRAVSEIDSDIIEQPPCDQVEIKSSDIEGQGVFLTGDVKEGEVFALARLLNNRTPVGRYTNHSDTPNAGPISKDGLGMLVALQDIGKGEEVTVDYREIRRHAKILDGDELCQAG